MKKVEEERKLMKEDPSSYVANPLNAFLLIKRLSFDVVSKINRVIEIANNFNANTADFRLPMMDFDGAIEGLIRLQFMYDLKPEDLARGVIQDKKYREDLTVNELFALGNGLHKLQMSSNSLSYLNLALKKNQIQTEMSDMVILESILKIHNETSDEMLVIETLNKMLEISPERTDLEEIRDDLELKQIFDDKKAAPKLKSTSSESEKIGFYQSSFQTIRVKQACNGQLKVDSEKTSNLRCRFESRTIFTRLAPFKVEEVYLNPYIAIYHDVISEIEIEAFKEKSKAKLDRAKVLSLDASSEVK